MKIRIILCFLFYFYAVSFNPYQAFSFSGERSGETTAEVVVLERGAAAGTVRGAQIRRGAVPATPTLNTVGAIASVIARIASVCRAIP